MVPFDVFERGRRPVITIRQRAAKDLGVDFQQGTGREDDGALDNVLQLTDVAGPRIRHEPAKRRWLDAVKSPPEPNREPVEQVLGQERNILGPLAERR